MLLDSSRPFQQSAFNPSQMSSRPRGISSMIHIGNNNLLVMARDSKIYTYNTENLNPSNVVISHAKLRVNSAFSSMSISPCRRWIAAGGIYGDVVAFNVEMIGNSRDDRFRPAPLVLHGNNGEVNSISWSRTTLATASDDGTTRVWRTSGDRVYY